MRIYPRYFPSKVCLTREQSSYSCSSNPGLNFLAEMYNMGFPTVHAIIYTVKQVNCLSGVSLVFSPSIIAVIFHISLLRRAQLCLHLICTFPHRAPFVCKWFKLTRGPAVGITACVCMRVVDRRVNSYPSRSKNAAHFSSWKVFCMHRV